MARERALAGLSVQQLGHSCWLASLCDMQDSSIVVWRWWLGRMVHVPHKMVEATMTMVAALSFPHV